MSNKTKEEEDLRLVEVVVALCPKCNGSRKVCVKEYISKETKKEFAEMLIDGYTIKTTNVIVARGHKFCICK